MRRIVDNLRQIIKRIPVAGPITRYIYLTLTSILRPFPGSKDYWIRRYDSGGNSGLGSYDRLAEFKAAIINNFVKKNNVTTVIELGCGDGNQLKLAEYPSYIGFDVSPKAIELCRNAFQHDETKNFKLIAEYSGETAQLTLSLDVIYHLVEDDIFASYMKLLFSSSTKYVIIYSSDHEEKKKYHVRSRQFTEWVNENISGWKLINHIPNIFPYDEKTEEGSWSDFFIYEKD